MARQLSRIWTGLGGISGLLSIVLLIWKGGALFTTVQAHETRIATIEFRGSDLVRQHVQLDDQREAQTDARLKRVEEQIAILMDMRSDLKAINAKLDAVKERIDEHVRTK